MAKLWERMTMTYGHRWVSAYGVADDGTWAAGLAGCEREDLGRGLAGCLERGDGWPPSLPEFRALCAPAPACHRDYVALPRPPVDPEVRARHMAQMRDVLARLP